MWIRSQSLMTLEYVRSISIRVEISDENNVNEWSVIANNSSFFNCLGGYDTKEMAIEVLDEIQRFIQLNHPEVTYYMPKR